MAFKDRSPFYPGRPAPVELFTGRQAEIERILRSARQVAAGKQENLFLQGEYGIGKSSLAHYVRLIAEKEHRLFSVHTYVGTVTSLESVVKKILEELIRETARKNLMSKFREFFKALLSNLQVDLFGLSVEFDIEDRKLKNLIDNFLPLLRGVYEQVKDDYRGILLILDDLNGVAGLPLFASMIKSMVDEIATSGQPLPLLLLLAGVEQRRFDMIKNHPSVGRIFDVVEIKGLSPEESVQVFKKAFDSEKIVVDGEAMDALCRYAGGMPKFIHEIGDAVFWIDRDNHIDAKDAYQGALLAAENIGKKYLDPEVYAVIRSAKYKSILRKLARAPMGQIFQRSVVKDYLTVEENKVFDQFLRKMKGLGVIKPGEERGEYLFANELIRLYLSLEGSLTAAKISKT
ncbi:ATP-binding protein [candidate division KSB1 bacterium]|nr:ATP-binding protein [candidate division KSB1 bacterium]